MFIELHQTKGNLAILVNTGKIQTIAQVEGENITFVYFHNDLWLEVTESYEEIKMMLTGLLIAKTSQEEDLESLWNRMVYGSAGICKREDK